MLKVKFILIFLIFSFINSKSYAEDVSNKIANQTGTCYVLSCITRLELYFSQAKNLIPNEDISFNRKMQESALKVSIPYLNNIREKTKKTCPLSKESWDKFYSLQAEQVAMNFETNSVAFDTYVCVRDLVHKGVIYPPGDNIKDMPAEQRKVFLENLPEDQRKLMLKEMEKLSN